MDKLIQAKDIPYEEVVEAIRSTRGRNGVPEWASTWDVLDVLKQYPPAVAMVKLRSMVKAAMIGGCVCSTKPPYCRGDFTLPPSFAKKT